MIFSADIFLIPARVQALQKSMQKSKQLFLAHFPIFSKVFLSKMQQPARVVQKCNKIDILSVRFASDHVTMANCGLVSGSSASKHLFMSEYRGESRKIVFTKDCVEPVKKSNGQNIQGGVFRPISGISVQVDF